MSGTWSTLEIRKRERALLSPLTKQTWVSERVISVAEKRPPHGEGHREREREGDGLNGKWHKRVKGCGWAESLHRIASFSMSLLIF